MKTYHLYLPNMLRVLFYVAPVLAAIMGMAIFFGAFPPTQGGGPPKILGLFPFGIGIWYAYWVFSTPHKIVFHDTGVIEVISVLRQWHFRAGDIRSIKPLRSQIGFLIVRTQSGSLRLLNQFDDFHDFIVKLKTANPTIELRGC